MFVIVQCMTNLRSEPDYSKWSLDTKLGMALRHAGVSITVTSATDVVAFAVGAVTVRFQNNLPEFRRRQFKQENGFTFYTWVINGPKLLWSVKHHSLFECIHCNMDFSNLRQSVWSAPSAINKCGLPN